MSEPDPPGPAPGAPNPANPAALTSEGEPRPVADLDEGLLDQLRPLHRIRWIALVGYVLLVTVAVIVLAVLFMQQSNEIRASCQFFNGLAPLPAAPAAGAAKPTKTAVIIIAGSRRAYAGEGCGKPPPPDPSLIKWARIYGVPLS